MLPTEAKPAGPAIAFEGDGMKVTAVTAGSVNVNDILPLVGSFSGSVVFFLVLKACKMVAVVKSLLVLISRPGVRKRHKLSIACPA